MRASYWIYYKAVLLSGDLEGCFFPSTPGYTVKKADVATVSDIARMAGLPLLPLEGAETAFKETIARLAHGPDPLSALSTEMAVEEQSIRNDPQGQRFIQIHDQLLRKRDLYLHLLSGPNNPQGVDAFIVDGVKKSIPYLMRDQAYVQEITKMRDHYSITITPVVPDSTDKELSLKLCFDVVRSAFNRDGSWRGRLRKEELALDVDIKWLRCELDDWKPVGPVEIWSDGNLVTF